MGQHMNNDPAQDNSDSAEEDMVRATVLVVDDEANIVTLLQTWLETIGCEVQSASDGETGFEKAREINPDLILMDGMMPRMSGFDACRRLKEDEATRDIPVIFLTVQGEVKDVVKGLELGAHGYMTKPFKPQELLARVRSTLKIKQIQDRLKVHTQKLRQQWNWMHGVVESLPMGLLVYDPELEKIVYFNERLKEMLKLEEPSDSVDSLKALVFQSEGAVVDVWGRSGSLDQKLTLSLNGNSLGSYRVRLRSFEKNGRVGRQILIEESVDLGEACNPPPMKKGERALSFFRWRPGRVSTAEVPQAVHPRDWCRLRPRPRLAQTKPCRRRRGRLSQDLPWRRQRPYRAPPAEKESQPARVWSRDLGVRPPEPVRESWWHRPFS